MHYRVRHKLQGEHVRVGIWASKQGPGYTYAKLGELAMRVPEWQDLQEILERGAGERLQILSWER